MPDSLAALLIGAACVGVMPMLYMAVYRLYLKIAYNEAAGTVLSRDESFKRLKFKGFKREDVDDLPLKAFVEFDTSDGKVVVESVYEYDNEEYERVFASKQAAVLFDRKHPDKNYVLKNEYKRRFIKVSVGFLVFALLAAGTQITAFIYLGML